MCVSSCGLLYEPGRPLEEITCPCKRGYWDIFQERFIAGDQIRAGKAPPRVKYEAKIRAELSKEEYEAKIRHQWITHFLNCEIKRKMDDEAEIKGLNDGSTLRRATNELMEIARGDYKSRGRSQSLDTPGRRAPSSEVVDDFPSIFPRDRQRQSLTSSVSYEMPANDTTRSRLPGFTATPFPQSSYGYVSHSGAESQPPQPPRDLAVRTAVTGARHRITDRTGEDDDDSDAINEVVKTAEYNEENHCLVLQGEYALRLLDRKAGARRPPDVQSVKRVKQNDKEAIIVILKPEVKGPSEKRQRQIIQELYHI